MLKYYVILFGLNLQNNRGFSQHSATHFQWSAMPEQDASGITLLEPQFKTMLEDYVGTMLKTMLFC